MNRRIYLVNHTLKKICGPYKDVEKVKNKIQDVCKRIQKANKALELIKHKDTYVIYHDIPEYTHVSISGNEHIIPYKTNNQFIFIERCGVYCIKNDTLNIIYVGETTVSFHKRWRQHCSKPNNKKMKALIEHPDTVFQILEITNKDKAITLEKEQSYIEHFKSNSRYVVLGGSLTF